MESLARLYHHYRARLSLKGFMRVVGQPYWRLRDFLRSRTVRQPQDRVRSWALAAVTEMAEKEPTDGYRRVGSTTPSGDGVDSSDASGFVS